jgi:hypothetical protein
MRSVKGNKGLLLEKVTKPASGEASRFCGFCIAATAPDLAFVPYSAGGFGLRGAVGFADFALSAFRYLPIFHFRQSFV